MHLLLRTTIGCLLVAIVASTFPTRGAVAAPIPVPQLTVLNATAEQQATLTSAIELFENAGLELPPLVVEFFDTREGCNGNGGIFRRSTSGGPGRVLICHRLPLTTVHELAHAWAYAEVDDARRSEFLEHWNLPRWNDHSDDWNARGTEKAANTIAYTLRLTAPTANANILQFVCGYELLTGDPLPDPSFASCPATPPS